MRHLETDADELVTNEKYAIMVLNRPVTAPNFAQLWNEASLRCVIDGGMNRLLQWQANNSDTVLKPPHIFSGDFDSCELEAMAYAKACACTIILTPDQNETDFTKGLQSAVPFMKELDITTVLATCDTSGRLDQLMANVNTLFKFQQDILTSGEIMLMSRNSIAFLLLPGSHLIDIPRYMVTAKLWCALIPFSRTQVTTTGMKWDLGRVKQILINHKSINQSNNLTISQSNSQSNNNMLICNCLID